MLANDPLPRVLYIDLARRRSWVTVREDLFEAGLGGAGSASACSTKNARPAPTRLAPRTRSS